MIAAGFWIRNLLRLNEGMQLLLPILQTHREIGRAPGPPKKIEIIAETLMLIEPGHGAEKTVLPFESNRRILKSRRFRRGRRASKFSWFRGTRCPPQSFLGQRLVVQKIEFR